MAHFEAVCDSVRDPKAWLAARQTGAPASETPTILGYNRYQSALELWAIRHGDIPPISLDDRESVFWGHELELAIADGYSKRTKRQVVPFGLLIRSTRWPWMLATPDALVSERATRIEAKYMRQRVAVLKSCLTRNKGIERATKSLDDAICDGGWQPLQIKNIGLRMADEWEDGPPRGYTVQTVHEALVLGTNFATLAALIGGQQLAWDDIEVDSTGPLELEIIKRTEEFLESVRLGKRPFPDASESAKKTLQKLYPTTDPDTEIQLGTVLQEQADRFDEIGRIMRELEQEKKGIENQMRNAIEGKERARFANGTGFSLKTVAIGERTTPAHAYRRLTRFGSKRIRKEKQDAT